MCTSVGGVMICPAMYCDPAAGVRALAQRLVPLVVHPWVVAVVLSVMKLLRFSTFVASTITRVLMRSRN